MIGALLPLPLLILAWIGVIRFELAFVLDRWLLVGVLLFYGFVASRLRGHGTLWSTVFGFGVCASGLLVVLIKSTVGH